MAGEELKAEIARLDAKLKATSDADIVEALQYKLDALNAKLESLPVETEPEVVSPSLEMSSEEVEKQIRLARAHLSADRKPAFRDVLTILTKAAPEHPDVLELKADSLIAAKDFTAARDVLRKARKLAPKNVSIETKLAEVSIKVSVAGNIDDQMRLALSDTPLLGAEEGASANTATILSIFFPGVGHMVIGRTITGVIILSVWVLCLVVVILEKSFLQGFVGMFDPKSNGQFSMIGLSAAGIAILVHMSAIFTCAATAKQAGRKPKDRPLPPVDLPFE